MKSLDEPNPYFVPIDLDKKLWTDDFNLSVSKMNTQRLRSNRAPTPLPQTQISISSLENRNRNFSNEFDEIRSPITSGSQLYHGIHVERVKKAKLHKDLI